MTDAITLSLPADGVYLLVARNLVASIATIEGATIEEIEDLRLATSEACSLLLEDSGSGPLSVSVRRQGAELILSFSGAVKNPDTRPGSDLAWILMSALVDDAHWEPGDETLVTLRKTLVLTASS